MKKRIYIFICIAVITLVTIPLINIRLNYIKKKEDEKWWHRSTLYNSDFVLSQVSRIFYPIGISIDPNQAVIGYNGWLYLGDAYNKTITMKCHASTDKDKYLAKKIAFATKAWEFWFKSQGVKQYRVIIGADKDSIYPEFLPHWVRQVKNTPTDTLLTYVDKNIYIDTRPVLTKAKKEFHEDLYYKTDTHWNALGGWVAFRAFAKNLINTEPSLRWPIYQQIDIFNSDRCGGDLANFLRIAPNITDMELSVKFAAMNSIKTKQRGFKIKSIIPNSKPEKVLTKFEPMLMVSKNALNRKRVLWLHDSFGGAMTPYMQATFSEILEADYNQMNKERYVQLTKEFKPEYVFITVVERNARNDSWVENPPVK